jgi:hypothetical protein
MSTTLFDYFRLDAPVSEHHGVHVPRPGVGAVGTSCRFVGPVWKWNCRSAVRWASCRRQGGGVLNKRQFVACSFFPRRAQYFAWTGRSLQQYWPQNPKRHYVVLVCLVCLLRHHHEMFPGAVPGRSPSGGPGPRRGGFDGLTGRSLWQYYLQKKRRTFWPSFSFPVLDLHA